MPDTRKTRRPPAREDGGDRFGAELARAAAADREATHRHPLTVFYAPEYWAEAPDFDTFRKSYWIERHLRDAPVGQRDFVRLEAPGGPDEIDDLSMVHAQRYLEAVASGSPADLASSNGFAWRAGVHDAARCSTQGVVEAATLALATGHPAGSLSAGLHHARRDRGAGFCTFNGLAVAARAAKAQRAGAVLILDLDAHCGGGTFSLVSEWRHVWHADVSVDPYDGYDPAGHPRASLDIVREGTAYLDTIGRVLDRLSPISFDLLIYNAGMDPFERCGVGGLAGITAQVLDQREQLVFDWARARKLPVAFVLAGGYTGAGVTRADLVRLHLLTIDAANPARPVLAAPARLATACPLGDAWRTWDFLTLPKRELPLKADAFNVARSAGPKVRAIDVVWERGLHDALYRPPTVEEGGGVAWRFEHASPSHTHCEVEVEGHRVHLDRVGGTKYGPGRSWTEIVAFVDGVCVAHGWEGGCSLGFGGSRNWPLKVRVSATATLVVTGDGEVSLHRRRRDTTGSAVEADPA